MTYLSGLPISRAINAERLTRRCFVLSASGALAEQKTLMSGMGASLSHIALVFRNNQAGGLDIGASRPQSDTVPCPTP